MKIMPNIMYKSQVRKGVQEAQKRRRALGGSAQSFCYMYVHVIWAPNNTQ